MLLSSDIMCLCRHGSYDTYMPQGVYCNILKPGCSSTIRVRSDGRADVALAPGGSFAICKACKDGTAASA